jgi:hypothetical protein
VGSFNSPPPTNASVYTTELRRIYTIVKILLKTKKPEYTRHTGTNPMKFRFFYPLPPLR